jgi:hypothetical protein
MISCPRLKIASLLVCLVAFLGGSCSQKYPHIEQIAPLPENVCRIAVVPFVNRTEYLNGGILFYRVFVSEFSRFGDYQLVPEGDIRRVFRQLHIVPGVQQPEYDQLQVIGDYLNADIMLSGAILQMKEVSSGIDEKIPYITVKLNLLDARSGRSLGSIYHVRDGNQYRKVMHFGVTTTVTQLATKISREIMEKLISKGLTGKCIE